MDQETVTLFFAILAVVAQVAVVAILVLAVGSALSPSVSRFASGLRAEIGPRAVGLAAAVAAACTAGSLYLSEVANFLPCRLCWYQRYAMYPLVLVLGAGAALGGAVWRWARIIGLVMGSVGAALSTYHILVEREVVSGSAACSLSNPCTIIWVEEFGYLTIPTMALSGFALIVALLAVASPPLSHRTPVQEAPA